ncbi:MAG: hypothetical protein ABSF54_13630 [Bryobacteraceae bacterium]
MTLLQKLRDAASKKLKFEITDEDYWEVRNDLIAQGEIEKARGRGGSVYRVEAIEVKAKTTKRIKESDLYSMVGQYIETLWVKDNEISQFVLERTASQGKRKTGGRWTRPDFALVALKSFLYIPSGKILELITFEVKPENDYRIEGVFETAAHSRFSHKSYLVIYTPDGNPTTEDFQRVKRECERFGLGLVTFTDAADASSYETLQEAGRREPDPADVNGFIASQISRPNQTRILGMVK